MSGASRCASARYRSTQSSERWSAWRSSTGVGASRGSSPESLPARGHHVVRLRHRTGRTRRCGSTSFLLEPGPPALLLGPQHGDDVCDGPGVILGAGVAHRVGPSTPDPGLHRAPERHGLGHHVGPVDVHQHRIGADDVADGRQQAGARPVRQILGAVGQQRRLIPHQLAAPHPVRGAPDGAGCSPARSWPAPGRACPRRAGRAGAGSTRPARRRTTRAAAATCWWSAGTGRTPAARRQRRWRAAIRRAACCRCAATRGRDTPSGGPCGRTVTAIRIAAAGVVFASP